MSDAKYSPVELLNNKQRMIKIEKRIKIYGSRVIKKNIKDSVFYKRTYKSQKNQ